MTNVSKVPVLFIGHIYITTNTKRRIARNAYQEGLRRHVCGDWGDLESEETRFNDAALKNGGRILSAYGEGMHRFWIVTESDRSITTILLPEDCKEVPHFLKGTHQGLSGSPTNHTTKGTNE